MGLKKYIITGHVIEIYEYRNYIHGKEEQELEERPPKKTGRKIILIQIRDAVIQLDD